MSPPPAWNPGLKDRVVELGTFCDEQEATMAVLALGDAGVPGRVVGGSLSVIGGDLGYGTHVQPSVWVMERDAAAARQVLAEVRDRRAAERAAPAAPGERSGRRGEE